MKGFVVFYINFFPELGQNVEEILALMKKFNADVITKIQEDGYNVMFVGTTKEATRVEKVDFEHPFPRHVLPHVDLVDHQDMVRSMRDKLKETDEE